jgi:hypothetical protein
MVRSSSDDDRPLPDPICGSLARTVPCHTSGKNSAFAWQGRHRVGLRVDAHDAVDPDGSCRVCEKRISGFRPFLASGMAAAALLEKGP